MTTPFIFLWFSRTDTDTETKVTIIQITDTPSYVWAEFTTSPHGLFVFFSFAYHATRNRKKPTPFVFIILHTFLSSMSPIHTTQTCNPSIDFVPSNNEPPLSRQTFGRSDYTPRNLLPHGSYVSCLPTRLPHMY